MNATQQESSNKGGSEMKHDHKLTITPSSRAFYLLAIPILIGLSMFGLPWVVFSHGYSGIADSKVFEEVQFGISQDSSSARFAPIDLGVTIEMPAFVHPGDDFYVTGNLNNPGVLMPQVPVFFILQIGNEFWFWPSWTHFVPPDVGTIDYMRMDIPNGTTPVTVFPVFSWPDTGSSSGSGLFFYGAILTDDLSAILGTLAAEEWGYGPIPGTATPTPNGPTPTPHAPTPTRTSTPLLPTLTPTPTPPAPTFTPVPVVHDVSIVDDQFQPNDITINAGDSVRWTHNGSFPHTTTSGSNGTPDGLWNSGTMSHGQIFTHAFSSAGDFSYYCEFHWSSGMTGIVRVQ
jgi:plastocyanin